MTTERPRAKRSPKRASRFASRDLLANPLPVMATSLAAFLAVFALLTSRIVSGHDPALARPTATVTGAGANGSPTLRTTASGRVVAAGPAAGGGAAVPANAPTPPLTTAASGAGAIGGGEDG